MKLYIFNYETKELVKTIDGLDEDSCYEKATEMGYSRYPFHWSFDIEPNLN
jgi:hypothetical protein